MNLQEEYREAERRVEITLNWEKYAITSGSIEFVSQCLECNKRNLRRIEQAIKNSRGNFA